LSSWSVCILQFGILLISIGFFHNFYSSSELPFYSITLTLFIGTSGGLL
jgi:hypothetical protein